MRVTTPIRNGQGIMGRHRLPVRPIKSIGQLALVVGGSLVLILGVLWALFIVTMMIFGGIDLSESVTGRGPRQTTGAATTFLAMIGVLIAMLGGTLFASAWSHTKSRPKR